MGQMSIILMVVEPGPELLFSNNQSPDPSHSTESITPSSIAKYSRKCF